MSAISKLEKNSTYLKVIWSDGEESKFNYLWLRDNCPTAHDKDSRHRMFNILKVSKDINPKMSTVDVVLVIGANDVVNPSATEQPGSPIYGMPIIEVHKAKTVIILKRSMSSGFAGVQNPLLFKENSRMLFGDAKESISKLVAEFKD